MNFTVISYRNIHQHGDLFVRLMEARYESFVRSLGWELPAEDGMEFDQYDTPQSRWVAIQMEGRLVAGFRLTMTTARCGDYSYMLKDASEGRLASIPAEVIDGEPPVSPDVWECSRAFVDETLPAKERGLARKFMIESFMPAAEEVGATALVTLTNRLWKRWMPMHGVKGEAMGPMVGIDGEKFQAVMMTRLAA